MSPWGYVLLASLVANGALGWAWQSVRDDLAVATVERDGARSMASACSDGVEALREQSEKRAKAAATAQARARAATAAAQHSAQIILSTPASVPGDDCGSARQRIDLWLQQRGTP